MTLFIRDNQNRSIVDLELYIKRDDEKLYVELSSVIEIIPYSEFLLANLDRKEEIIDAFSTISELRSWLWESYFMDDENTADKYDEVINVVGAILKKIAADLGLNYIED
jgi:hypothetical protein